MTAGFLPTPRYMPQLHHQRHYRRQGGFALLLVLGLLLVLAAVAARLDAQVDGFRQHIVAWQQLDEADLALHSARDEVLYALATRQLSDVGFGPGDAAVRVDGQVYRLPSGVLVSVQDARGLISVAALNPPLLHSFLLQQGVPDAAIPPLIDALADYGDNDDLRRINGAEAPDYAAAGLPPPRNDWPLSPYELRLVAGWAQYPQLWQRAGDFFTAWRGSDLNPNTAPPQVLAALPGATPAGVQALIERRRLQPFSSAAEVAAVCGIVLGAEHDTFYPGLFYRLRLWWPAPPSAAPAQAAEAAPATPAGQVPATGGGRGLEYNLLLTPNAPRLPWQVLESRVITPPALPPGQTLATLPLFPLGAATASTPPHDLADPLD